MKIVMHSGASWSFNSRPRTEGIICHLRPPFTADQFQFSPSHRGHPRQRLIMYGRLLFQFSPSHRGHRPGRRYCNVPGYVSILALAQRASDNVAHIRANCIRFNSRPRTEGIERSHGCQNQPGVSILALAQRASIYRPGQLTTRRLFQFSPSHRGHQVCRRLVAGHYSFQFSPSHRGHRPSRRLRRMRRGVSILALAQRASEIVHQAAYAASVSILALAQRASYLICGIIY